MKKTIILTLALLLTTIFNYSFGETASLTTGEPSPITTLIINADVTVVLVDNDKANLEVTGNSVLRDIITLKEEGDTLIIGATKNRNVKKAGIIYVPARQLRKILINSAAHVASLYTLQIPKLDVIVNGDCSVYITSIGEVNMTDTPLYIVEQTTDRRRISASILEKLNNYYLPKHIF